MATPEICPNCGADVPSNAKACPECGSCEETGWSDAARYDHLGLPDEDFNYDEFVEKEFGKPRFRHGSGWFWCVIGILVAAIFLVMIFWWK